MNHSQIEQYMASLQMKPEERPLWEIALQLAKISETLDRLNWSVKDIHPGGNPQ